MSIDPKYAATQSSLISPEEYERLRAKVKDPTNPYGLDNPNPCVRLFGYGPQGAKCKDCKLLIHYQQAASWYKCPFHRGKRGGEGGPKTDHRVRWDACSKFEKKEEGN